MPKEDLFILLYLISFFILVLVFMEKDFFGFYHLKLHNKLLFNPGGSFWVDFWTVFPPFSLFFWLFVFAIFFYGLFWFLLSLGLSLAFFASLLFATCFGSYLGTLFSGCLAPFFWSFAGGLGSTLGCYFLLSFFGSFWSFWFLGSCF